VSAIPLASASQLKVSAIMRRIVAPGLLLTLATALVSCSSSSKSGMPAALMPAVAGSWEFILNSTTTPGQSTGMEVALQEGQTLEASGSGQYVYNGQISASGAQINFVAFTPGAGQNSPPNIVFGGNCAPAADNTGNSLTGSISGVGGSMNFTFTENGNVFNVTATLDASGTFIDSGTYTAQSGSACNDSGTISSGKIVPKLSGTYTGQLLVNENNDNATATLSESGAGTLTVNMVLSGADNASFTLTGPVTGNAFSVQGTFAGTTLAYYGYYELTADSSGTLDVSSLYLVNAASPTQQAGLLTVPQTP
jgi:hypothetical protein